MSLVLLLIVIAECSCWHSNSDSVNLTVALVVQPVCSCEGEEFTVILHQQSRVRVYNDVTEPVSIIVDEEEEIRVEWQKTNVGCCFGIDASVSRVDSNDDLLKLKICYTGDIFVNQTSMPWICAQNDSIVLYFESAGVDREPIVCNTLPHITERYELSAMSSCTTKRELPSSSSKKTSSKLAYTTVVVHETMTSYTRSFLSSPDIASGTSHSSSSIGIVQTTMIRPTTTGTPKKYCVMDKQWDLTPAGTNATLEKACFGGTVDATRRCGVDGEWEDPYCLVTKEFSATLDQIKRSSERGLSSLSKVILKRNESNVSLDQCTFLLDEVLRTRLSEVNGTESKQFTEEFMTTTSSLIDAVNSEAVSVLNTDTKKSIGTQVLLTMDDLALNIPPVSGERIDVNSTIFLKASEYNQNSNEDTVGIAVGKNSIALPTGLLQGNVRVGSLFYQNLSQLLSPQDTNGTIVSSIISSALSCNDSCAPTLNGNITVHLHVKDLFMYADDIVECVFFDFERRNESLPTGNWSSYGCSTTFSRGDDVVVCSCNHLTHFAILLSPSGSNEVTQTHYSVLNTIGLVLVPISLCCMLIVILTYTGIKSLWSMRNYIHVMLCVSLFMAQLMFIVGIERIENEKACSAIAVLLQYFFLVSFMWMLMEGVVLYVTLVKVFIKSHKTYVFAYTVASYGVPAVYMLVVVPVGFLVEVDDIPGHTHYSYRVDDELTACWLNYDTGFVWAFIAPVVIILLVNGAFFIMAVVIMRSHFRKQMNKDKNPTIRQWLKTSISLTVVLGVVWLVGLLVFRRELLFVAYLVTIFIAAQGVLLFVILVLFSQQVREAYMKLWHRKKTKSRMSTKTGLTPLSVLPSESSAANGVKSSLKSDQQQDETDDTAAAAGDDVLLSTNSMTNFQLEEHEYEVINASYVCANVSVNDNEEDQLSSDSDFQQHETNTENHYDIIVCEGGGTVPAVSGTASTIPTDYEVPIPMSNK